MRKASEVIVLSGMSSALPLLKAARACRLKPLTILSTFIADAGNECGYRIYATSGREGEYRVAFQLAEDRKASLVEALLNLGVERRRIAPRSHWVDYDLTDLSRARSAVLYTFPKQGVICTQAELPVEPLELWFDRRSTVISGARMRDMRAFVDTVRRTNCNIRVRGAATKEIVRGKNPEKANRDLAKERVTKVARILAELGLEEDRIIEDEKSYLPEAPDEGRFRNAVISVQ